MLPGDGEHLGGSGGRRLGAAMDAAASPAAGADAQGTCLGRSNAEQGFEASPATPIVLHGGGVPAAAVQGAADEADGAVHEAAVLSGGEGWEAQKGGECGMEGSAGAGMGVTGHTPPGYVPRRKATPYMDKKLAALQVGPPAGHIGGLSASLCKEYKGAT